MPGAEHQHHDGVDHLVFVPIVRRRDRFAAAQAAC
jgi:hypothetical protein